MSGDCFPIAYFFATDAAKNFAEDNRQPLVLNEKSPFRIVHGLPIGQGGDVDGIRYWHAWVELTTPRHGTVCMDRSQEENSPFIPQALYYEIGTLDEDHVWRFTLAEANKRLRKLKHTGPWVPGWEQMGDAPERVG